MKKLVAAAIAAVSIQAFAAWERVGALQVADTMALCEAAGKIGQMIGNPMVAAGAASGIAGLPTIKFFGPTRPNSSMVFVLFADSRLLAKDPEKAFGKPGFYALHPVSMTKDEFMKRHEGAYETNGVIVVKGTVGKTKKKYVVFSADGKWAAMSDNVTLCRAALKDVAMAEKPMDGEVVRLMLEPSFWKAIAVVAEKDKNNPPQAIACVKSIKSAVIGAKVSDSGVDVVAGVVAHDGSMLSTAGLKPLADNPLAFAGREAFCAYALAEDAGLGNDLTDEQWASLLAICTKHGINVAKYVARVRDAEKTVYTIDLDAIFKFAKEEADTKLGSIDFKALADDIGGLTKGLELKAKSPARYLAITTKGFKSQWTAADRFSATLPEAASQRPFYVGFYSLSSLVKEIFPRALELVEGEQRDMMKQTLAPFAAEQKRGIAFSTWREGGETRMLARVSADEIRGLGGLVNAVTAMYSASVSESDEDADGNNGAAAPGTDDK